MTTTTAKRITKATIKSFVAKNRKKLLIRVDSHFDGMTDGVEENRGAELHPALDAERLADHNLGIQGVWLVLGSRDWFERYETETHIGYTCGNCCGKFTLAIAK